MTNPRQLGNPEMNVELRARIRHIEDVDPRFLCCNGIRENFEKHAGQLILIKPGSIGGVLNCKWCGARHDVHAIKLVAPVEHYTTTFAEFIDIDEGVVNV